MQSQNATAAYPLQSALNRSHEWSLFANSLPIYYKTELAILNRSLVEFSIVSTCL